MADEWRAKLQNVWNTPPGDAQGPADDGTARYPCRGPWFRACKGPFCTRFTVVTRLLNPPPPPSE